MNQTAKTLLLTGSTSPIGRAIARELAADGWSLILHTCTQIDGVKALAEELRHNGLAMDVLQLDLGDPAATVDALKNWQKSHPKQPVTGLVTNAAISRDGLMLRTDLEKVRPLIEINLLAAYNCTQVLLRTMIQQRYGRIIFIGSTAGVAGNAGQAAYAMAKAGLEGLARSLAREYGSRGITANVVAPGWIRTPMSEAILEREGEAVLRDIPAGRLGTPEEVAATIRFMASDTAAYINGQTLMVNGGLYMK